MINFTPHQIHPINIPSITDMGYHEAYEKELVSNKGYSIVRCTADIVNESGFTRTGTYAFRVPTGENAVEFIKQYTKSTPSGLVEYTLEDKTLVSKDLN